MLLMRERIRYPSGRVRLYQIDDVPRATAKRRTPWIANLVLKEWGAIVGNLLTTGQVNYRVSRMYLEFANVASPGDTITPPSFDRETSSAVAYYNSLALSADADYLRVPIVAATLGSSGSDFPYGNLPTFFAMSSGVAGIHGKPFSDANNSLIYGGALVAAVVDGDPTQDLVLSRFYLLPANQQPKLPTSQVGIEWELDLE